MSARYVLVGEGTLYAAPLSTLEPDHQVREVFSTGWFAKPWHDAWRKIGYARDWTPELANLVREHYQTIPDDQLPRLVFLLTAVDMTPIPLAGGPARIMVGWEAAGLNQRIIGYQARMGPELTHRSLRRLEPDWVIEALLEKPAAGGHPFKMFTAGSFNRITA